MIESKLFGKIIIPLFYYLRGDKRFKYFKEYRRNLKKSKKEIQELQLSKLKKLIKHAYYTTEYYHELFDSIGLRPDDIKSLEDIRRIPPLTKRIIQKNEKRLLSNRYKKLIRLGTGGSTGNRMIVHMDRRYFQKSRAAVLRDLYSAGIKPGERVAWIWGSPIENKALTELYSYKFLWWINRRIIFDVNHYEDKEMVRWLRNDFIKFRPDHIYGYSNLIYEVAKKIKEHNIPVPKIKSIVSTSEKLEHREFIENVFRCRVIDQYGSREVNSIGIEDKNGIMRISDDYVYLETDDKDRIILTSLESYGMPLIRYQNGDIGLKNDNDKVTDNANFSALNLKIGRTCEILYDDKGKRVTFAQFGDKEILHSDIKEWQIVQKSKELVHLNVVVTDETTDEKIDKLKQVVMRRIRPKKVVINKLKKFPFEKSGKKIVFKCEIKSFQD